MITSLDSKSFGYSSLVDISINLKAIVIFMCIFTIFYYIKGNNARQKLSELLFGKEVVKHFCLCNIWKYRYRSSAKNGEEDIKKSDQYIKIYERLCSNE